MCHAFYEKWQTTSYRENRTTNQDKIRILGENETNKYLSILEVDTIKQVEMKDKIQKEYLRTRKLLETKLSSRNLIKGINTWVIPIVRYAGPFLKLTGDKLKQMYQRTRKLMTMHKALYSRDDVDRLYVSRKEGGSGLARSEDNVDASIRLEGYIEKHDGGQPSETILITRWTIEWNPRKQKWERKTTLWAF